MEGVAVSDLAFLIGSSSFLLRIAHLPLSFP